MHALPTRERGDGVSLRPAIHLMPYPVDEYPLGAVGFGLEVRAEANSPPAAAGERAAGHRQDYEYEYQQGAWGVESRVICPYMVITVIMGVELSMVINKAHVYDDFLRCDDDVIFTISPCEDARKLLTFYCL